MIIYIIIYLIVFLLSFMIKKNKFGFFDLLLLLVLILFSGLRYEVGTDYLLYRGIYEDASSNFLNSATNRTGFGFSLLINFFYNVLHADFKIFILFCSFITITNFYLFFKKNSSRPGLVILLFVSLGYYTSSFNVFRQYLSLSIVLIGYLFFKKRKITPSIIFFIIGISIHSSSIIAVIAYFTVEKFIKKPLKLINVYIPIFIVYFFLDFFLSKILEYFTSYSIYLDYASNAGIGTYMMVLVYNFLLLVLFYPNKNLIINNNKEAKKFLNYIIIGAGLMLLQTKNTLFVRLVLDFNIFVPIILTEFYEVRFKSKKLESLIFYLLCFIYYLVDINSFGDVIPYKSIF